ncbi:MAG TPA: hypothetical protein VNN72_09365, partial [Polyangiaceae bacterium]|nr:hypothetical protein [Polyangiaceae bacterium]
MSQPFRRPSLALTSGLIATLAVACGHSKRFEDAFETSKVSNSVTTGGSGPGNGGSTSGNGGSTSGNGGSTS